jgi:hypothetical protein
LDFDALLLVSFAVLSAVVLSAAPAFFRDFFFVVLEVSLALCVALASVESVAAFFLDFFLLVVEVSPAF